MKNAFKPLLRELVFDIDMTDCSFPFFSFSLSFLSPR